MFYKVELTEEQYALIKDNLPVQRGNVKLTNLQVLNAILYVAEHGCKWRGLPKRFGRSAYHLHAHESMGEKWSPDACLRETSNGSDCAD
jgi:transposase